MKNFTLSTEVYERYLDASVELFMECYAQTITIDSDVAAQEQDSPRLNDKCKALIKAIHRRKKLLGFVNGSARMLKSAAILTIAFLALSSFLFITVDAVREPILDFYIKQNDGYWQLSNTPFESAPDNPKFTAPAEGFNENDPLGAMLVDDNFYLHYMEGNIEEDLMAIYYNDDRKVISLHGVGPDGQYRINTENAEVEQIKVSGVDAILSARENDESIFLTWYNTDLDMFLTLKTDYFTKYDLINIAEILNDMLAC